MNERIASFCRSLLLLLVVAVMGCTPQGAWDLFAELDDLEDELGSGPLVSALVANDPDDSSVSYGNGDTITVSFSQATNQVAVATKADLDAIFIFNESLGADYTGTWSTADTLEITVVDSTGSAPPTIGGLTLAFRLGNGIKNAAGTSTESSGVSPTISGDWGSLVGPTISTVVADDADNGDVVYGSGDTITVSFSQATNQVAVATKANLDAIFSSSQALGANYTGAWSAADTLVITVVDSTGATPPTTGGLTLTFQVGNGVKNAAGTSFESTGTSPAISGDWGSLAGPTISSVVADDADNADSVYSDADTITVSFSEATNQVSVATKANLDAVFSFSQALGANYTGAWSAADTLVISVVSSTGAGPPTIGGLSLTFQAGNGVKNAAGTSFESTGTSPVISGDWGTLAGPTIGAVVADDADNGDSVYSDGDTVTVSFSEATNQVAVATKANLDAIFSFSQALGANYTGAWSAADTLVVTVVDSTAAAPPTIGGLTLTFQVGNGVKNVTGTSLDSTGTSPAVGGDWGIVGPTISAVVADDSDDGDAVYSDGDTITVSFSEATNQVAAASKANLDAIFSFSQALGANYTGAWSAADTLVITVVDSTGAAPPTIGGLTVTFQVGNGVKNAAGTSVESTGTSPVISGDWGALAGPTISTVVADDADNADSVYGDGDTITVSFSEATNQVAVATKANLDAIFSFSQALGATYTGAWSTADTLVITVVDSTGAAPPTIGGLTLTFQVGNGVTNATGTSLESAGTSPVIGGDWGQGPITLVAAMDTDINEPNSAGNYGASVDLIMNHGGGDLGERRILVQFDLSPIPVGATVTHAVLKLTKTGGVISGVDCDVHRVTNEWNETEATWDERISGFAWVPVGGEYDPALIASANVTADAEYEWSAAALTSLVDDWHNGITSNYGLILGSTAGGSDDYVFASRTHGVGASRPKLYVEYTVP